MSSLETVVFRRGDVVFAEGDSVEESPYLYIIGSGKVQRLLPRFHPYATNSHVAPHPETASFFVFSDVVELSCVCNLHIPNKFRYWPCACPGPRERGSPLAVAMLSTQVNYACYK